MLLLEIGMGSWFLGIFTPSEAYRATTDSEIGKEILGGCVLVWVPVSGSLGWNDFRGGCIFPPWCWRNLRHHRSFRRFFFLAQFCAIIYKSIMYTGLGGQITGSKAWIFMFDWHVTRFPGWVRVFEISFLSVSAMGMYFVPIGMGRELGLLALLQLNQSFVRLGNNIYWQVYMYSMFNTSIHTCPIGLSLSLSISLFHDRLGSKCLLADESYSCCSSDSSSSFGGPFA